jgi:hypothetical protein
MLIEAFCNRLKNWFILFFLLGGLFMQVQLHAQTAVLNENGISIRALADRQRKAEEAEFMSRLNPGKNTVSGNFSTPVPGSNAAVQVLPPLGPEFSGAPLSVRVQETSQPAANTVMSVYGPESSLIVEVASKGGSIMRYRIGEEWNGHRIVKIDKDGVTVQRGGKSRLVPVGSRL